MVPRGSKQLTWGKVKRCFTCQNLEQFVLLPPAFVIQSLAKESEGRELGMSHWQKKNQAKQGTGQPKATKLIIHMISLILKS